MPESDSRRSTASLIKVLLVSGLITTVVGLFIALFVNTVVGVVLVASGLADLTITYVLPRLKRLGD